MSVAEESDVGVVWPLGRCAVQALVSESKSDLSDATVALLWDWYFRGDEIFEMLKADFAVRYPGVTFVDYAEFGNVHGPDEARVIEDLPDKLRSLGVDLVVAGVGA